MFEFKKTYIFQAQKLYVNTVNAEILLCQSLYRLSKYLKELLHYRLYSFSREMSYLHCSNDIDGLQSQIITFFTQSTFKQLSVNNSTHKCITISYSY